MQSQQGIPERGGIPFGFSEQKLTVEILEQNVNLDIVVSLNNWADPRGKIKLFMFLFKSRNDVYAKRWENKMR
jgi:hypothetical protein